MKLLDEPYWHKNKEWYYYDKEKMEFILTSKAPQKAIESYKEFYKQLRKVEKSFFESTENEVDLEDDDYYSEEDE